MAQVEIQAGPHRFVSLLSREAADELGLEPGMLAVAAVKSTNVSVEIPAVAARRPAAKSALPSSERGCRTPRSKENIVQLSARNQISARVTAINTGEAIANVELDANGVRLVASITVEAVRQLGLAVGAEVTAVIKASDVMIATGD